MSDEINIGSLDRLISIQKPTTSTDSDGLRTVAWSNHATGLWANISDSGANEKEEDDQETAINKTFFTLRYVSGVTYKMRVVFNSLNYYITSIKVIGRNRWIILTCEKRDNE